MDNETFAVSSPHLLSTRDLKRLYDELPDGDPSLVIIADELERRDEL